MDAEEVGKEREERDDGGACNGFSAGTWEDGEKAWPCHLSSLYQIFLKIHTPQFLISKYERSYIHVIENIDYYISNILSFFFQIWPLKSFNTIKISLYCLALEILEYAKNIKIMR